MPDVDRIRLFRHCPRCGAAAVAMRTHQLIECESCGLNLYFNPGAAAAAILLDPRDRVLLVRRALEPEAGKLAFPGGFVDDGESVEGGLRRELREEVGLEAGALEYLLSHPNTYGFAGVIYRTVDLFYIARVADFGRARPLDGVSELIALPVAAVSGDELAFESMRAAWREFMSRRG